MLEIAPASDGEYCVILAVGSTPLDIDRYLI
jgi:hypothetical protein